MLSLTPAERLQFLEERIEEIQAIRELNAGGKLVAALRQLRESEIQFIIVGSLAAALNGAPNQTLEVALVYSLESANIDRLLAVLQPLDAFFRVQRERRVRPDRSHLAGGGHLNLLTRFGPRICSTPPVKILPFRTWFLTRTRWTQGRESR